MIRTKSTVQIGGEGIFTPNGINVGLRGNAITRLIKRLFANNEQGFFYDPSDLKTQYQDATGTAAVNATGQPLGLMLDKSRSLRVGNEWWDDSRVTFVGESVRLGENRYRIKSIAGEYSGFYLSTPVDLRSVFVVVEFTIEALSAGQVGTELLGHTGSLKLGKNRIIGKSGTSNMQFKRIGATDVIISNISVKELLGNHAYQTTSAARPIFRQKPILGSELVVNGDFSNGTAGWVAALQSSLTKSGNNLRITATGSTPYAQQIITNLTIGKKYSVIIPAILKGASGAWYVYLGSTTGLFKYEYFSRSALTTNTVDFTATSTILNIQIAGANITVGDYGDLQPLITVKEITGYRTDENYIEYDKVDDKLVTNLSANLTNATVLRAIPNVGTQVKYNQTLPMLYEDSTNHAGLVAIDRALTRKEQLRLMDELDKRAGAVGFDTTVFKTFDNNQEGFVFDPNDLSTLYQNAEGTVPVTGVGQPVGLMLDKSKGLIRGVERVDEQDLSKWASGGAYGNWPQTTATSDTVTNTSATTYGARSRRFAINGGQAFEASALVKCLTADMVTISLAFGTAGGAYITDRSIASKSKDFSKISLRTVAPDNAASCEIVIKVHGATGVAAQVKDISVKQLSGNHAYQTTSASRPILRQNAVTGANYLEFDGSDDFLVTNSIDFTATDKVSLFAGVRKLSDATAGAVVGLGSSVLTVVGSFEFSAPRFAGEGTYGWMVNGGTNIVTTAAGHSYVSPNSSVVSAIAQLGATQYVRVNGVLPNIGTANTGTGNYGKYPLYIGRRGGASLPFNGHIYGLIGIGKLVSDTETTAIEKELAKRTGVTLNV